MAYTYTDATGRQVTVYQPQSQLVGNMLAGQDEAQKRLKDPGTYLKDTYNWMTNAINQGGQGGELGSWNDPAMKGMTWAEGSASKNPFLQFGNAGFDPANWYTQGKPVMDQLVGQGYTGGPVNFERSAAPIAPSISTGATPDRTGFAPPQGTAPPSIFNAQPNQPSQISPIATANEGLRPQAGVARPAPAGAMNLAEVPPDVDTMPSEDWRRRPGWGVTIGLGGGGGGGGTPVPVNPPVPSTSTGTPRRTVPGGRETGSDLPPKTPDEESPLGTAGRYARGLAPIAAGLIGSIGRSTPGTPTLPQPDATRTGDNGTGIITSGGTTPTEGDYNSQLQGLLSTLIGKFGSGDLTAALNPAPTVKNALEGTFQGKTFQDILASILGQSTGTGSQINTGMAGSGDLLAQLIGQAGNAATAGRTTTGTGAIAGNMLGGTGQGYGLADFLQQIRTSGLPGQKAVEGAIPAGFNLSDWMIGKQGGTKEAGTYGVGTALSQILSGGLPGQSAIEALIGGGGNQASSLLGQSGGTAETDTYGVIPLLKQIMTSGLEGQKDIEGLTKKLATSAGSGGLTPEEVAAYTRLIYEPAQEKLLGDLNRQGGGAVNLGAGGLPAELQRRGSQAFQDQLLTKGMERVPQLASAAQQGLATTAGAAQPYISMASQLGQGGQNLSLDAFSKLASSLSPYFGMASDLGKTGTSQGLDAFSKVASGYAPYAGMEANLIDALIGRGYQGLTTAADIAKTPIQLGQTQQGLDTTLLSQLLGNANQYLTGQQNFGLGTADIPAGLARSYLSGETQKSLAQTQAQSQADLLSKQLLGQGIGSVAGSVLGDINWGSVWDWLKGLGGG